MISVAENAGFCFGVKRATDRLEEALTKKLDAITTAKWEMLPLHVEFQGARVIAEE